MTERLLDTENRQVNRRVLACCRARETKNPRYSQVEVGLAATRGVSPDIYDTNMDIMRHGAPQFGSWTLEFRVARQNRYCRFQSI